MHIYTENGHTDEFPENDPGDERVFYMWEPLSFHTKKGYDYLRNGIFKRISSCLLRGFAAAILSVYNKLAFGFKITGKENLRLLDSGAVTICNHVHQMDCTMINLALLRFRIYYLTLEANFKIPVIRHIIRILGAVPVSGNPHTMHELFDAMTEALHSGSCVQVYPEGVLRPYYKGIRKFRNGAFYLSVKSGAPILPMTLTYHTPKGIYSLYKSKPCIHLNILKPIYPDLSADKKEAEEKLRIEAKAVMEESCRQSEI